MLDILHRSLIVTELTPHMWSASQNTCILRFILAILVLFSHIGVSFLGINPGVMAVVIFYVISGYVMAALIEGHYKGLNRTKLFYGDRLLRIYPRYALYAALSWIWLVTVGHPTHFLILTPSVMDILNNVLIVPLNFFMYNGWDRFTLLPPAWSLGAEVLFYALASFLGIAGEGRSSWVLSVWAFRSWLGMAYFTLTGGVIVCCREYSGFL
jgi:peptidoglycan/LPS O-acetylase OafA/YrhL